jgi:hypothetical protein
LQGIHISAPTKLANIGRTMILLFSKPSCYQQNKTFCASSRNFYIRRKFDPLHVEAFLSASKKVWPIQLIDVLKS